MTDNGQQPNLRKWPFVDWNQVDWIGSQKRNKREFYIQSITGKIGASSSLTEIHSPVDLYYNFKSNFQLLQSSETFLQMDKMKSNALGDIPHCFLK